MRGLFHELLTERHFAEDLMWRHWLETLGNCEYVVVHLHVVLIHNEPVYIHTDATLPIRI